MMENQTNIGSNKKTFSTVETILFVLISLIVGLLIGMLRYQNNASSKEESLNKDEYIETFIDNYNFIIDNYYEDVDKESLINKAIAGMMESLNDPYSVYIDEEQQNSFNITLDGSYEGIGVEITKDPETGYILVTAVFKESPAHEAGMLPGDLIMSVDNTDIKELSPIEFSNIVRKQKNATHSFKALRNGEEIILQITRNVVTLKSVLSESYDIGEKKVGYIYIGIFATNTLGQFEQALNELEALNIDYLIIDVRGNTGGHLTTVDGILDLFLNKNQIMYQFEKSNQITPIYGTGNEKKKYNIILLGDESSASASEVLIAGLRDNLNSVFIGKQTYGKGTVQELVTLSDGTQYKITIKKWLTPKGNWINDTEGIIPDIEVELSKKYYETYDTEDDSQLNTAFEYVKSNN